MKILMLYITIIFVNINVLYSEEVEINETEDADRIIFIVKTQFTSPAFSIFRKANDRDVMNARFPAMITDDFPVTPVYRFGLNSTLIDSLILSITGFWHSTGSRVHYADYSGEYRSDIIFNTKGIGLGLTKFFPTITKSLQLGLGIETGYFEKDYYFSGYARIGSETVEEKSDYNESGIYIEPEIILAYNTDNYFVGLSLSYLVDINSSNNENQDPLISYNSGRIGLVFGLNSNIFK